jgi:hypothetical protein
MNGYCDMLSANGFGSTFLDEAAGKRDCSKRSIMY